MGQNWERQRHEEGRIYRDRGERERRKWGMIEEGERGTNAEFKKMGDKKYTIQVSTQEMQEFGQKMVALCNYR